LNKPISIYDRSQPRPDFSTTEASKLAFDFYGLTGPVTELTSERDQNFHIAADTEEQFVLKIAAASERKETLEFQNAVMMHLGAHTLSGFIPQLLRTKKGDEIGTATHRNTQYFVRLLTYHKGELLSEVAPQSPELLRSLGRFLGEIDCALERFTHTASRRDLKWDLQASLWIKLYTEHITGLERRALVDDIIREFESKVVPIADRLRTSVVHNDANDYNVLVRNDGASGMKVTGIIDFGDMLHTYTASEVAVAAAYAMLDKNDPLAAACSIVEGYNEMFPLEELELEILYTLIRMRLAVSVTNSALQQRLHPDNQYLLVSERPAWDLLEKLQHVDARLPYYQFRNACKLEPFPQSAAVAAWLQQNAAEIAPVVDLDFRNVSRPDSKNTEPGLIVFDLSIGSSQFSDPDELADTNAFTAKIFSLMKSAGARVGIGRYDEPRLLYTSDVFRTAGGERRTIHIGMDLFMKAGSPVFAPLDGVIHTFANNAASLDYGPTIILEHSGDEGQLRFFTLYGHLSEDSLEGLQQRKTIRRGDRIASIGNPPTNGGWPPHLHFQIICDLLGKIGDFPGVAPASQREVWLSICPHPNLILGIGRDCFTDSGLRSDKISQIRSEHIGSSLSIAYRKPLHIVKGSKQYLYDADGRAYLDAVNNVAHVGHCHPRVVKAAQDQIAVLNTNTRYLHQNVALLSERLCATLPDSLSVCYFVCSGSEANELALRLARAHTGGTEIICVDAAYHGNTSSLIDISPYKFDGPGGTGAPPHVHKVPMPDTYRGTYRDQDAGLKYAELVRQCVERIPQGKKLSAFISESALGCGGQIILPGGFLKEAFRAVRKAEGVCIVDEVQTGLGRAGSHFWAFETQGVVPDIVTIGKPFGNGHPLAAVVTTREIAASFANGMEYFNTFGGSPVSCAVGLAVLDVIEDERLQENALKVGTYLRESLNELKLKHRLVGDVRGLGLFIGVEMVLDRDTLEPASKQAAYIVERMKESGILVSTDGPFHNVIKIKPPLIFSKVNADSVVERFDSICQESFIKYY
jgi:4-aminobutyrate aminotransferase-like enzyme/Ser/Thr protein kinase RdoA (MazF antagonist)